MQLYWAIDVSATLAGMRKRRVRDKQSLRRLLPNYTAKATIAAGFTMGFMRPFFRLP